MKERIVVDTSPLHGKLCDRNNSTHTKPFETINSVTWRQELISELEDVSLGSTRSGPQQHHEEPQRPLGEAFVSGVFWLFGFGVLLPWNAFTSVAPYFQARFCQSESKFIRDSFEPTFAFLVSFSAVLSMLFIVFLQKLRKQRGANEEGIKNSEKNTQSRRLEDTRYDEKKNNGMHENNHENNGIVSSSTTQPHLWTSWNNLVQGLSTWTQEQEQVTRLDISGIDHTPFIERNNGTGGQAEVIFPPLAVYQQDPPKTLNEKKQRTYILLPLVLNTLIFLLSTVFIFLSSISSDALFYSTLIGLVICGVCQSIASTMFVSLGSIFPVEMALNPYFSGQALSAILLGLINYCIIATNGEEAQDNFFKGHCKPEAMDVLADQPWKCPDFAVNMEAFYYFSGAIVILILCMMGYHIMAKLPITRFFTESATFTPSSSPKSRQNSIDIFPTDDISDTESTNTNQKCADTVFEEEIQNETFESNSVIQEFHRQQLHDSRVGPFFGGRRGKSAIYETWLDLYVPSVALFLNMVVTLSVFPGYTVELASASKCVDIAKRIQNDLFFPMAIVVYNLFDLLGRLLSKYLNTSDYDKNVELAKMMLRGSVLKFLLIPLFLLCPTYDSYYKPLFLSDAITFILLGVLGLTTGLIIATSFTVASNLVGPTYPEKQRCSTVMNLSLHLGLFVGSMLSFVVLKIGSGHW